MNNQSLDKHNNEDGLGLDELFKPVFQRLWKIFLLSFVITALVFVYLSLLKPSYQATATLQIGSTKPSATLTIKDAFKESNVSSVQIETQFELLKSRKFAARVIEKLNLLDSDEFIENKFRDSVGFLNSDHSNKTILLESAISTFQQRLLIKPLAKTELVKISYTSNSPERAKKIANQIGETYLEYQNDIYLSSQENTSTWLIEQLTGLELKLQASERSLQKFREDENIVDIKSVVGLVDGELTELTSSLLRITRTHDDLKITYQYIIENQAAPSKLVELNEISNNNAFIKLRSIEDAIEQKKHELSRRYGPKHPKIIAIQAELDAVKERIQNKAVTLSQSIVEEYSILKEKVKATQNRLKEAKANYLRLSRLDNQFSQLQREVRTNKELYNSYLIRFKEADAMGNYKANLYVRFIDRATTPKTAIAPRKKLTLLIAFILSLMVLVVIVIIRDFLRDTLSSQYKQANFTEANIIAILPIFKVDKKQAGLFGNDLSFAESVNALRSSILYHRVRKAPKILAVTSSSSSEGKSTVASYLARSFGEMEKVLLIEADLRLPTLAKKMNLSVHRPGLSNLLADTHSIEQCIIRGVDRKLDLLTSGITPANPLVFLSMKRFELLLKYFGNHYDRIIIETPPINIVSDALVISKLVESVLYVVDENKTKREQIRQGLKLLKQVNANIEGIVINQSRVKSTERYREKYYKGANKYVKMQKFKRA
ncbi:polysaccharide biosynthesis tyrosine autokinase [Colwellia sp. MSW7]|uniref:non-specific protein-tyrosine kinase n=1 Tax=Colwellia maritima TaxID=2912588 RepID=A0ABS9X6K9_9GAMM|nr:polysaccharide biosynthesis tyrosine autokinase [Colwellia maritima]MCI2285101.1 polysaccharide biosynthesis tyrosine autokinase [Colwellia maritima]